MKKRIISLVMTVVMTATIMVSIAPVADVNATTIDKVDDTNISVSYDPNIENHPDYQGFLVNIPREIIFTEGTPQDTDATVSLTYAEGYDDADFTNVKASIYVTSANDYNLYYDGENLEYLLRYGSTEMAGEKSEVGELSVEKKVLNGTAFLPQSSRDKATKSGPYMDTLMYHIEYSGTVTNP